MSLIQLPSGYEGKLPDISSPSEENLAPIEVTLWKCRRQLVTTVILSLGVFSLGTDFGWAAVGVTLLKEANILQFDESIMTSLFMAGALLSGPVAGYSMLKLGRKYSMLWHAILLTIGWTIIPVTKYLLYDKSLALTTIYIGRFTTGFASAGCFTIAPIYVGELCDHKIHSRMESVVQVFLVLGSFYPMVLGTFLDWFHLSLACWIFPPILTVLIVWIPKSPQYLQASGHEEKAKKAMYWLTIGFTAEEKERLYKRMKAAVQLLSSDRAMRVSERRRTLERQRLKITSRPVLHPLIVSAILIFFQQASGANLTSTYMIDIFKKGGLKIISPKEGGACMSLCYVIFYGVASVLVDRTPRKCLLIASSFLNGLMLTTLGFYFWFAVHDGGDQYIKDNYDWVTLLCGIIINIAYSIGVGPISWIVVSEINHPDWHEIAGSVASTVFWLTAFICTLVIPYLRDWIMYHWLFWIHACFCLCNILFISLAVFETYGKTPQDIMDHYKGGIYVPEGDEFNASESLGSILAGNMKGGKMYSQDDDASIHSGYSDDDVQIVFDSEHGMGKGDTA